MSLGAVFFRVKKILQLVHNTGKIQDHAKLLISSLLLFLLLLATGRSLVVGLILGTLHCITVKLLDFFQVEIPQNDAKLQLSKLTAAV